MGTENIIETRRHPAIAKKLEIWKLINDSYAGGTQYAAGNHLVKYPREPVIEFNVRKQRALFFNHVQPMADILAGFIYREAIERNVAPELQYMQTKASKRKSIGSFMQNIAIHSLLYTCGVLVDSPAFDSDEVLTLADRKSRGLNPYCVFYYPWQIRDYAVDDNKNLLWILLDNSYWKNDDPKVEAKRVKRYRLWTTGTYQDIIFHDDKKKKESVEIGPEIEYPIGEIPFQFVNWRDINEDYIAETPFEDIALFDKQIYNVHSYLDEMLAAGSFKSLFFPIMSKGDVPETIIKNGIGSLSVVTYNGNASKEPSYKGADLGEIDPFLKAMQFYLKEEYQKIGMNEDRDKTFVQSGTAKALEFEKTETILRLGAEQLESTERKIYEFAAKWEGKDNLKIEVKYPVKFNQEDLDIQLNRLYQAHTLEFNSIQEKAVEEIVKKVFYNLEPKDLEKLLKDVKAEMAEDEENKEDLKKTAAELAQNELDARNNTDDSDDDDADTEDVENEKE